MDSTESIVSLNPLENKWSGFGWSVTKIDGHDLDQICTTLREDRQSAVLKPRIIIAHTIKGKGISFMENIPIWHYRMPNREEMETVKRDLELEEL